MSIPSLSSVPYPEYASGSYGANQQLTPVEQQQLSELQDQDRAVRARERAHVSASDGLPISGPNYTYKRGPDGKLYAVAGDVQIFSPPSNSPEQSLVLAHKLEQSALAPAAPSSQDEYVANQAAQMAAEARRAEEAQNRQQLYNAAGGGHIDTFA